MKYGMRKPSVSKSFSARTTGKIKRQAKRAFNPTYGKKGMGWINSPSKAAYNKVYNKTTASIINASSGKSYQSSSLSNDQNNEPDFPIWIVMSSTLFTVFLFFLSILPFWLILVVPIVSMILAIVVFSLQLEKHKSIENDPVQQDQSPEEEFKSRLSQGRSTLSAIRTAKVKQAKLEKAQQAKPITTFSVSKVGEYNNYHYYETPGEEYLGEVADIDLDPQYNDKGREREAYVVSVNGTSIGEITSTTFEKLTNISTTIYNLTYIVAAVTTTDNPDKTRVKIAAYDIPDSSVVRVWGLPLVGISYNNRSQRLQACGIGVYGIKVTEYQGTPAVMVLDPFGNDVGFIPKEHAGEVANYYNEGRITRVFISKIDTTPQGAMDADLQLEILR